MFANKRNVGEMVPFAADFAPLARLRNEMEAMFERFLPRWWAEEPWLRPEFDFEVEDKDNEMVMKAPLPGFEPAEINLEVLDNRLRLTAEHKEEVKAQEKKGAFRRMGKVNYAMTLPPGVEASKVEAFYRNGVLEVHVPRKPEARGRRVEVKG